MWSRILPSFVAAPGSSPPPAAVGARSVPGHALVLCLLAGAALVPSTFHYAAQARDTAPEPYRALRTRLAFHGLEVDAVQSALARTVPADEPLALGPGLLRDPFVTQRLWEGLYPRRFARESRHTLEILADGQNAIGTYPGHGYIHLLSPAAANASAVEAAPPEPAPEAPPPQRLARSWWRLAVHALSALGLGLGAWLALARILPGTWPQASAFGLAAAGPALLLGAIVLGLLATVATWLQLPLLGPAPLVLGLTGAVVLPIWRLVLRARRQGWPSRSRTALATRAVRALPALGLGLIGGGLFLRLLSRYPISGWDGRSIWFFRAHQLAAHGMFARADVTNPVYLDTHPAYPLLFPAWLAHFTSLRPFDERQASLGLAVLLLALTATAGALLARRLGTFAGLAFASALFWASMQPLHDGYPDRVVTGFLLIGALGLSDPQARGLGLAACAAAALTKREGLVLAAALLALHALFSPSWRAHTWRVRARSFVALVPAMGHALWYRALGLPEIYRNAGIPPVAELRERLGSIGVRILELGAEQPVLHVGFAGLLLAATARSEHRDGRVLALAALAALGFSVLVFLLTPLPFTWHANVALPRVASHALWLAALAGILHLAPVAPGRDAASSSA